jgi:hypothetical protein
LRTAVISTNGNGSPAGAGPEPSARSFYVPPRSSGTGPKAPRVPKKKSRLHDFIVRYDGKFIGHFRARRPLEPKEAFARIREELAKMITGFRPELLALFQPVRLRTGGASARAEGPGGELIWFKD